MQDWTGAKGRRKKGPQGIPIRLALLSEASIQRLSAYRCLPNRDHRQKWFPVVTLDRRASALKFRFGNVLQTASSETNVPLARCLVKKMFGKGIAKH